MSAEKNTIVADRSMVLERIGPSRAAAVAAIAAIAATAAAAGSVGMVAQPLRMAMVWVGLAIVAIAVWPRRTRTWRPHAALAGAVVVSLMLLASGAIVVGLLGVALVLAAFACHLPQRRVGGLDVIL